MISDAAMEQIVDLFREMEPHIVLTHTPLDPFNPDHPVASQAVQKARLLASGAGVASALQQHHPADLYYLSRNNQSYAISPQIPLSISLQ